MALTQRYNPRSAQMEWVDAPDAAPGETPYDGNLFGWIGHNLLGGAQQQVADGEQAQIMGILEQLTQQRNPYQGQPNPYDQGNAGLTNMLALQQGGIQRQYAGAEQDTMRSLAQRGALGTAQETSALRQLAMDRARALSGNEASLRASTYDKGVGFGQESLANQTNWDTNRRNTLLGARAGQRDYYQQQADAPKQALANIAGLAAKAGTAYATGGGSLGMSAMGSQQPQQRRSPLPGGGPYAPRDQWGGLY